MPGSHGCGHRSTQYLRLFHVTGWKLGLSLIFQTRAPVTERCRSLQHIFVNVAVTESGQSYMVQGSLSEAGTDVGWPDSLGDRLFVASTALSCPH